MSGSRRIQRLQQVDGSHLVWLVASVPILTLGADAVSAEALGAFAIVRAFVADHIPRAVLYQGVVGHIAGEVPIDNMAQFTPNNTFTSSSESDWAYLLGSLGWNEHIVFTKESLIDFLKTKNITVSTSFKEIKDVPQYATIGKFDRDPAAAAAASSGGSAPEAGVQSRASTGNETGATLQTGVRPLPGVVDASGKPYRSIYKVTEHAGRSAMGSIFGSEDDDQESKKKAVEQPPARPPRPDEGPSLEQQRREAAIVEVPASSQAANSGSYRPSTRVT
ncbi:hypothetical protein OC845_005630 [Tilletia horrida]|nr:hypothetical protein OC845_005630 [Tilletia horrida]